MAVDVGCFAVLLLDARIFRYHNNEISGSLTARVLTLTYQDIP